jgi:anti-sigma B factor antagonist
MLKIITINDIYVASFVNINRFNALLTEPVKEQLINVYNKPDTHLILDLSGVVYIDSSGFGVFLSVLKKASMNYGKFKICNIKPEVHELFRLLQLQTIFEIYPTLEDCLQSFKQ